MKKCIFLLIALFFGTLTISYSQKVFWTEKTKRPVTRMRGAYSSNVVDGKIYMIGGGSYSEGKYFSYSLVDVYDPVTDVWDTTLSDMPTTRWLMGSHNVVVGNKIYAIGGLPSFPGNGISIVEVYDVETGTWDTCAPMPTPRSHLATCVVDGKIYAIGGSKGDSTGWDGLKIVERYDPVSDTWDTCANMPTARLGLCASVVNGKIYAIGGSNGSYGFSTVEEYDPATDSWTQKSNMPTPRLDHATTVAYDMIYAIGGVSKGMGKTLDIVEVYNPATNTWIHRDRYDLPVVRTALSACTINGLIYALPGLGKEPDYPDIPEVLVFDPSDTIVNIPDTTFLHALIDEGVDTNGDSLISFDEAETVTKFKLWGETEGTNGQQCIKSLALKSLVGIEAFINLDTLDINCTDLDSLSLTNHTKLLRLRLTHNQLTNLDVSNCSELKELICNGNSLIQINVSNNKELEMLYCPENELTSLDLSNNTALGWLHCADNHLTSLDVSSNTALYRFICGGNQLATLDVSTNTALKNLLIDEMPSLHGVCVWTMPFPPDGVVVDTTGSPNVEFIDCSSTGINAKSPTGLSMYPNPTNDLLTVQTNEPGQHLIEITSLNGKLLYSSNMGGVTHQIDLSSFQKGLYFITIRSGDYVRTEKIIKL